MTLGEIQFWQKVSAELGIEVITPFTTTLPDGTQISASALVRDFGAVRGMVVAADYETIKPHMKRLVENGFGYSANFDQSPEAYDRHTMIEVLADWGWSGEPAKRPDWLP